MKKSVRKPQKSADNTTQATRGRNGSRPSMAEVLTEVRGLKQSLQDITAAVGLLSQQLCEQNQTVAGIPAALENLRELAAQEPVVPSVDEAATAGQTVANESPDTDVARNEEPTSEWDRIRAAFLQDHDPSPQPEEEQLEQKPSEPVALDESTPEEDDELDQFLSELPNASVVPDNPDEMKKVIIDRDRTISTLVRRLQKRIRATQPLTSDQLADIVDNLPDELAQRAEHTLKSVDQQVRLGELELSLERARVSRQLSKLEETRERLEQNARTLGLNISADGLIEGDTMPAKDRGSKGRRWLGVLGFGN